MKERFIHVDILRGICMFTVIYSHILLFCIGYEETSLLTIFLRSFYLNSFFFISGFVSYNTTYWNLSNTKTFLAKKLKSLLIPSFFCLGVFCFFHKINYITAILETTKAGYWFTFVLFEMFCLYALYSYITNTIKNKKLKTVIVIFLALVSYLLNKIHITNNIGGNIFNIGELLYYLPLFWIGIACKINIDFFHRIINLKFIKVILFMMVMIGLKTNYIPLIVYSIACTLFIYTIIKDLAENRNYKKAKEISINILNTIGQNTLPIYFLHYFFLFRYPNSIINYMHELYSDNCFATHSCAGLIEFIIVGITSLFISFTCVYIAEILNYIPYIGALMFGNKINHTK